MTGGETEITLSDVGWKPVFQQQLMDFPDTLLPARVVAVQRSGLTLAPPLSGIRELPIGGKWFLGAPEERPTVGDWVLVDPETQSLGAVLERTSLI